MPTDCLFVYGTLLDYGFHVFHASRGMSPLAKIMQENFQLLGKASTQGRLFEIAGYPGLQLSDHPQDRVLGELYQLKGSIAALHALDDYEGCTAAAPQPHEFVRQLITVTLEDGRAHQAWGYLYNHATEHCALIASGDYRQS